MEMEKVDGIFNGTINTMRKGSLHFEPNSDTHIPLDVQFKYSKFLCAHLTRTGWKCFRKILFENASEYFQTKMDIIKFYLDNYICATLYLDIRRFKLENTTQILRVAHVFPIRFPSKSPMNATTTIAFHLKNWKLDCESTTAGWWCQ